MVVEAVSLLLGQLNQYFHQLDGTPMSAADPAIMGNIAQLDVSEIATDLENHVVLTLVNVAEEVALKNGRSFTTHPNGIVEYHNAPLHLNLFLLFTANYRNYETALKRLSQVMTFFQGRQKFTPTNSPNPNITPLSDFSITVDLISLSFEEINHLWGSLGGKQLPFAAYRGRLITLHDQRILESGGNISQIEISGRDATA